VIIDIIRHYLEAALSFVKLRMDLPFQVTAGSKDPTLLDFCTLCIFIASSEEGQNVRTC